MDYFHADRRPVRWQAGAIYVVDRGYIDFARLYVLHQAVIIATAIARFIRSIQAVRSAPERTVDVATRVSARHPPAWRGGGMLAGTLSI